MFDIQRIKFFIQRWSWAKRKFCKVAFNITMLFYHHLKTNESELIDSRGDEQVILMVSS